MFAELNPVESIAYRAGTDPAAAVAQISLQYRAQHPPHALVYHVITDEDFRQNREGRYEMNWQARFPEAQSGQIAYAGGRIYAERSQRLETAVNCYGPIDIWLNGSCVFRSGIMEEMNPNISRNVMLELRQGWNSVWIRAVCIPMGFGCLFGSSRGKYSPLYVLSPFSEREGRLGWAFTPPFAGSFRDTPVFPDASGSEANLPQSYLPRQEWREDERHMGAGRRLFGLRPGQGLLAWARVDVLGGSIPGRLVGRTKGPALIWLNETCIHRQAAEGAFCVEVDSIAPNASLLLYTELGPEDWGFELSLVSKEESNGTLSLKLPWPVKGCHADSPWLYYGPATPGMLGLELEMSNPNQAKDNPPYGSHAAAPCPESLFRCPQGEAYWRVDRPGGWVRPVLENDRYGRWSYPLGVTMYGLLQAGRQLDHSDLLEYASGHIKLCTEMYAYTLWDQQKYGFPSLNTQLADIDLLDDCGSIGSAMLEAHAWRPEPSFLQVGERIADYILHTQERREDGAFYRRQLGTFNENTLWADDLYMSTPFLMRWWHHGGQQECLEECVSQFLLFRSYLYHPHNRLMSHVYNFNCGAPTGVHWGRGNGWVMFSLSELLEYLPKEHPKREELLGFFNDFALGLVERQGSRGLWHQVLNDPESYEESSCTAMFAYAFARGVRFGWLDHAELYRTAAQRAWEGLCNYAIDRKGNVYGVCQGSCYSFTRDYYKYELSPVLNDTHGIGIVLLAGIEMAKLAAFSATKSD